MAEEKVKCEEAFDKWIKKASIWIERQKAMLETTPTPEQIEAITKLYSEVRKLGKEFAKCEVKAGSET